jgi:hypothetical protein
MIKVVGWLRRKTAHFVAIGAGQVQQAKRHSPVGWADDDGMMIRLVSTRWRANPQVSVLPLQP